MQAAQPIAVDALPGAPGARELSANQWRVVTICAIGGMLETMDIYLIAFVLTAITGPWGLSYGESATILLASGAGAIFGALAWGAIADRIGRKAAMIASIWVCSGASLVLMLAPEGDWVFIAIVRTILGFGTGGFFIFIMMVQEFMPARSRGFASGIISTCAAGGLLLGSLSASFLMPVLGWRGMFAIGALPALLGIVAMYLLPESPRWALTRGNTALGRRNLEWALGPGPHIDEIVAAHDNVEQRGSWREVFAQRRSLIAGTMINFGVVTGFYGTVMWAPTLLQQVQRISPAEAASIMIVFSSLGLLSRFSTGWLADRIGRRRCGAFAAIGAALCLLTAGFVGHGDILDRSLFWLPFLFGFFLADASFAVMAMFTSEVWPSGLRGRGSGVCYAVGSFGKIIGPGGLALLVGSSNMVRPEATVDSIVPAFAYLGAMFFAAGLVYAFIARETKGRSLEEIGGHTRPERGAG